MSEHLIRLYFYERRLRGTGLTVVCGIIAERVKKMRDGIHIHLAFTAKLSGHDENMMMNAHTQPTEATRARALVRTIHGNFL